MFDLFSFAFLAYDASKVDYWLHAGGDNVTDFLDKAVDMSAYSESIEWDILHVTGQRSSYRYPCCPEEYVDITYRFHIRRKTLFYTINLVIPWALISCLTVCVFYLPSQSFERITLSISILVILTVFILVLYESIPPTSLHLPLMSKYLLLTLIMVACSVSLTVLVLNIHFRHPHHGEMPQWVRKFFLEFLAQVIFHHSHTETYQKRRRESLAIAIQLKKESISSEKELGAYGGSVHSRESKRGSQSSSTSSSSSSSGSSTKNNINFNNNNNINKKVNFQLLEKSCYDNLPPVEYVEEIKRALDDVNFISTSIKQGRQELETAADWVDLARVLDRLFLLSFATIVIIGTCAILGSAPSLYDPTEAIA